MVRPWALMPAPPPWPPNLPAPADGQVAGEGAVGHGDGGAAHAVEAAPLAGPTGSTPRLIGDEGAVGDAQGSAGGVEDTAAPADLARAASRHIADQVAAGDGECRTGRVEDAAAIPPAPPVGDRQAGDDNVHPTGGDVEDPVGAMAADRQSIRPGPLDGQALVDHQLAMGQADGPGEVGVEVDRLSARCGGDLIPQRPGHPVIEKARDRAQQGPIFHPLQLGQEPPRRGTSSPPPTRSIPRPPIRRSLWSTGNHGSTSCSKG
ncbi:MAG: hypothetical protein ACXWOA_05035 [Isosphaeraceae bacterium]